MNTLVLTSDRPHRPAGGYALRVLQNIRALASLGPVDVVSVGVEDPREAVMGIREWQPFSIRRRAKWSRAKSTIWPLRPGVFPDVDLYHSSAAARWIRGWVSQRRYDVVVIEGIRVSCYLGDVRRSGSRVVFDAHNVEDKLHEAVVLARSGSAATLVRRAKDRLLRRRMTEVETHAIHRADVIWACSAHDAQLIECAYRPLSSVVVVPNGVDVGAYRPPEAAGAGDDWSRLPVSLFYSGTFGYSPNEDAAMRLVNEVLPAVRARGYEARLILVGRNPSPSMIAAGRRDSTIIVTGAVDSVLPYLEQPCIVTLPITLGSGTRLKIVEAFAAGRPVVSTAKGAEGIDGVDGEHLMIRDRSDAIAAAAIELWQCPPLRQRLCNQAFELVRGRYSWSVAAQKIAQSLGAEPAGRRQTPGDYPCLLPPGASKT
jgi:glycosyltransferase involved in cell wall biosynthesis